MLRRFARGILFYPRAAYRLFRRNRKRRPIIQGLPPGVSFTEADGICRDVQGRELVKVAFQHLSGWKESGAYLMHLTCRGGETWQVIFKNSVYGEDQIPALQGFPALAGPPEYSIYRQACGDLCRYLPEVYRVEEVEPKRRYRYFMEDLNANYKLAFRSDSIHRIIAALPELHQTLQSWAKQADTSSLIHYGSQFSTELQVYVEEALTAFQQAYPSETLAGFLEEWPRIAEIHCKPGFDLDEDLQPVHGDLNLHNVMFNQHQQDQFKLLDWEWAGWSQPYSDLASVLKHRSLQDCQDCIAHYAAAYPQRSLEEHLHRYYWYQLERSLMDASFMAKQILLSPPKTTMNVREFLENSLRQAANNYQLLRQQV